MGTYEVATPLSWPTGWPRTERIFRLDARFTQEKQRLTVSRAVDRLMALPAPGFVHHWREVLGDCRTLAEAEAAFREKAKRLHPDQGGDQTQMAELNGAMKDARGELK